MSIITRAGKGSALTHAEMDNNFLELSNLPAGTTYPKDSSVGIKVNTSSPDWPWFDMEGVLLTDGASCTLDPYIGNIKQPHFAEGQDGFVSFHMPHDYVPNTDMYIHVHWSHDSSVVTGGSVTWVFETTYSKGHNQDAFIQPVLISVVDAVSTIPYQHKIAETVATVPGGSPVLLDRNHMEVDGILMCRLYLDSNDISTNNASIVNPFVHFVDLHYQSKVIGTKNKAPNFYN